MTPHGRTRHALLLWCDHAPSAVNAAADFARVVPPRPRQPPQFAAIRNPLHYNACGLTVGKVHLMRTCRTFAARKCVHTRACAGEAFGPYPTLHAVADHDRLSLSANLAPATGSVEICHSPYATSARTKPYCSAQALA